MRGVAFVLGVGLVGFWGWALGSGAMSREQEPWPGFRDHELSFAVPDVVVGIALLVAASCGASSPVFAARLALLCAGALAFLGVLDASYLARTWALRSTSLRRRTALVVMVCLGGAVALTMLTDFAPMENL